MVAALSPKQRDCTVFSMRPRSNVYPAESKSAHSWMTCGSKEGSTSACESCKGSWLDQSGTQRTSAWGFAVILVTKMRKEGGRKK